MTARHTPRWRQVTSVLAVLILLALSSAAVVPGHWHSGLQGRNCDLCRISHLPTLGASLRSEIQLPAPVVWHGETVALRSALPPVFAPHSPRAPPV
jgi:hypothetical protein